MVFLRSALSPLVANIYTNTQEEEIVNLNSVLTEKVEYLTRGAENNFGPPGQSKKKTFLLVFHETSPLS